MKTFSSGVQDAYPIEVQEMNERGKKMEEMRIFKNEEFGTIRTMEINGEIWFIGKDVADNLKHQNGSRDINRHVERKVK